MKRKLLFLLFILFGFAESHAQADVVVTNTNYQAAFIPGYPSVYTVTVTNNGPNDASNVLVTNPIPAGITQFSWTGNSASGTDVPLNNTIAFLNVGDTVTYTITLFVPVGYTGTLDSQATAAGSEPDPTPADNTALDSDVAPAPASADIVVFKTDNDLTYTAGQSQIYTVVLTNHGPAAATNVTIEDLVPANVNPALVTWSGDNSTSGTGNLNDAIPNMAVGDTIVYTVTMPIPSDFDQTANLVNTVTLGSATADPNPLCPNCVDIDTPDPLANIITIKTNNQTQYLVDEETTYTITVENQGPSDAVNVNVADNMPPGISQMTWSSSLGPNGTGNMLDTIPVLAAGETVTYTVTIYVPSGYNLAFVNLTNTVAVTSDTPDPVPACPGCSDTDTPRPRWVTVDTTTYTIPQLVEDILIDSDCANVSNFTWQAGAGANIGIGYFHKNNSNFPLKSGAVIRCGSAKACEGPFTDGNTSTIGSGLPDTNSIGYNADPQDLHGVSVSNGNPGSINDVSYIQFNFLPLTDNFSFDFLFASNEYGTFQCTFGDVFAFILKDQVTGVVSNLAVIPSTSTPVSVTSIRDTAFNGACPSVNPSYFDVFNQGSPANAAIDMRGQTVQMTASSTVVPNHMYSIKLVIGDYQDSQYDSAVFIEAGSFNVGQADLGDDMLVSTGTAGCYGSSMTLDTELDPTVYDFEWSLGGQILPDTTPSITVTEEGEYCVRAYTGTCEQEDCILVEFRDPVIPPAQAPDEVKQCFAPMDLTSIEPDMFGALNPANYEVGYYTTQFNAENEISPIPNPSAYNFPVTVPETTQITLYVKVLEVNSGFDCYVVYPIEVILDAPGIEDPSPAQTLCPGQDPDPFSVETTYTDPDSISYVYFTTPQVDDDMYTGGTLLSNVTPAADMAIYDPPVLGSAGSLPNVPGTYYVYAIANPAPTDPCKPSKEIIVTVSNLPTASISIMGAASVCPGDTSAISFTGTPNATVTYTVTGTPGNQTVLLDAAGNASFTTAPLTADTTYDLVSAQVGTNCIGTVSGSVTVTILPLPTATISGDITICDGQTATITFNGTPNATVTYTVTGTPGNQTIVLNASGTNTITTPALSLDSIYTLVSVQAPGANGCQQNVAGSAFVTVNALPTATISGTATVCSGSTATITFNGTPDATITYTVTGTPGNQTIVLDAAGTNSITTPALTASSNYSLVSVQSAGTPTCSQNIVGTATVSVQTLPVVSISGNTTICSGDTAVITFNGTPNATVTYTVTGTPGNQVVVLDATGTFALTTPVLTTTTTYNLVSVQDSGSLGCNQAQAGSATVTVLPLPDAALTGTAEVCQNGASQILTFTGSNGTAPYTFTYHINTGPDITITSVGNTATVTQLTDTAGVFQYYLTDVQGSGSPACSQALDQTATITVLELPTASISGTASTCQNDDEPLITFTGSGGTAPYTFTYNIGTGPTLTVSTNGSDNSVTVPVPTDATGTFDYHLLSVLDSGTTQCGQNQTGTASITILVAPTITTPTDIDVCDDNNDGFSCLFVLSGRDSEITGGNAGLTVTYHETLTDAQTGANPIASVGGYCNIVANDQTLYVRVFDPAAPACYSTTTLDLHVHPVPVPNPVIPDYALCDFNDPGDGLEAFDLSTMDPVILNGQSGVTVTYYLSSADAAAGVNAIPTAFTNTQNPQPVCARLEYATTGCFAVACFNVVVDPLPSVFPSQMSACGTASGISTFDLTTQDLTVSGGVLGMSVNYFVNQADAQGGDVTLAIQDPSAFQNTANPQVIYALVRNDATGCFAVATVTLTVSQGPAANTPQPLQVCDPNNDCFAAFDLTAAMADIFGSPAPPAGVSVTFHETLTDAQNGQTPIGNPSSYTNIVACDQPIYVSVVYDATGCRTVVGLALHVNLTPQAAEIGALEVCDDDTDGIGTFNLDAAISDILGGLDPSQHTVTFYLTQADAQAPTGQITNVLGFHNTTPNAQTIWVRLQDDNTGCFDVISLDLIVNPKPALPPTPTGAAVPYSLCDYNNPGDEHEEFDLSTQVAGILNGQVGVVVTFHQTQAQALAGTDALPDLYINGPNAQTLWVRMENQLTGCFVLTTMDLRVEPLPELIPPPAAATTLCDDNSDGIAQFDFNALVPVMLQGAPNITVTFHETLTDAQGGNNALASPYTNIVAHLQPIYVRAQDGLTGCWSVMMIELRAVAAPVVPPLDDLTQCDGDASNQDGISIFDLTGQQALILNSQTAPASDYVVTYHESQADALAGANPIVGASNYANTVPFDQIIWVRVELLGSGCADVGSFGLHVDAPLGLTTPSQLAICDDGPTSALPQAVFDLTVRDAEITGGTAGYTVSYYQTQADALADTNAIQDPQAYTNIANAQTLFVAVTGPAPSFCRSFTTLTIRVLPLPVPVTADIPVLEACDASAPAGTEAFDLTQNEGYIRDNDPQLGFEYYTTLAAAQAGDNTVAEHIADPANFETGTGTVYIRVERITEADYQGGFCYVIVEQPVEVNPLPEVAAADAVGCDASGTGATTYGFTLSDYNATLLAAGQDPAGFSFAYFLDPADAQAGTGQLPDNYTNTSNPQVLTVRVTDNDTGCVSYVELTLRVLQGATASNATAAAVCDTDTDGVMPVDLTQFDATVLGTQAAPDFTVAYFATQADALANTGALTSPYDMASGTVYAVVTNTVTGCRSAVATVSVTIEPLVAIDISSVTSDGVSNSICIDFATGALISGLTLDSGLPGDGTYAFQWTLAGADIPGATGPTYTIGDPAGFGDYGVRATSALGCVSASDAFTVVQSGPAAVPAGTTGYTVSGAFSDDQTVIVTVQGYGTYHYQLDDGPILDNGGVFTDVPPGVHTVTIYDMEGNGAEHCGSVTIGGIQTVDYPKFFTPNGDGINDTWNIDGIDDFAKIFIYDRYGKLLKQISPTGEGWNGMYNGQPLPSTDYWFTVEYPEATAASLPVMKEFKAHFSLKR